MFFTRTPICSIQNSFDKDMAGQSYLCGKWQATSHVFVQFDITRVRTHLGTISLLEMWVNLPRSRHSSLPLSGVELGSGLGVVPFLPNHQFSHTCSGIVISDPFASTAPSLTQKSELKMHRAHAPNFASMDSATWQNQACCAP